MRAAVIVLACLWVYSPVCHPVHHADWLWDDDQLLTANQIIQHRISPDPSVPPESRVESVAGIVMHTQPPAMWVACDVPSRVAFESVPLARAALPA